MVNQFKIKQKVMFYKEAKSALLPQDKTLLATSCVVHEGRRREVAHNTQSLTEGILWEMGITE